MTTHWFGPNNPKAKTKGAGHPPMFGYPQGALHFDPFPEGGGCPNGFVEWAFDEMQAKASIPLIPSQVLHLCSGSMKIGICVDIRAEKNPTIVADCRSVPLGDNSFDFIMADPPYSEDYASNLYQTEAVYPKPGQILKEACRLLRPGGLVGLLHFQVPMSRKPLKLVKVYGVTTGAGYAIRAWTLFQKAPV
jgi:SAM-dependent methyltransferase